MQKIKRILYKALSLVGLRRQVNPTSNLYGSISQEDESGVKHAIQLAKDLEGPIVELGVLFGHTTNFIATLADSQKQIIAVDNFKWNPFGLSPEAHELFTRRTLQYILFHRNTELIKTDSSSFFVNYKGVIPSMIFIDADHSYEAVKRDINAAIKLGIRVISGHDYSEQHEGVMRAVNECFKGNFEVFGTVWVSRLR